MKQPPDMSDLEIKAHSHRENVARRNAARGRPRLAPIDDNTLSRIAFGRCRIKPTRVDLLEVSLLLVISVIAQFTNFSAKQGRAVLCGDSVQYIASAEALLDPELTPHFEMRKPGYAFFLAAVKLVAGNMGWAAVAANHLFLALLPVCAYLFGRHLQGRLLGWIAALVTVARLDTIVWGNRMMSEALFVFLFSFGLLAFALAIARDRHVRWALVSGALLGLAWLTRGSATPVILVAGATLLILLFSNARRYAPAVAAFSLPILACAMLECGLNHAYAGRFRPSNATVGAAILQRARHFEGSKWPTSPNVDRVLAFLPERGPGDAYIGDYLDVWVARHRAIAEYGMDEWEYDDLMGQVGRAVLADRWSQYWRSSLRLAAMHLMRTTNGQTLSPVDDARRTAPIKPRGVPRDVDWDMTWFAYYATPHLTAAESQSLYQRAMTAASTKAPFGDGEIWKALRYWKTMPIAQATLDGLRRASMIWPGIGLLFCLLAGWRKKLCVFMFATYLFEALFIGFLLPTNERLQFIWFVTDSTFAAVVPVVAIVLAAMAVRRIGRRLGRLRLRRPAAFSPTQV